MPKDLNPKDPHCFHDIEQLVFSEETLIAQVAQAMLVEIRRLRHELVDPNYMFASGRVPRGAIIYRDQKISDLLEELKKRENPK